jgi:hypothetical protein
MKRNMSKRVSRKEFIERVDSVCGVFSIEEVSEKLGKSESEVFSDVENNKILAVENDGRFVFPAFQVFGGEGNNSGKTSFFNSISHLYGGE